MRMYRAARVNLSYPCSRRRDWDLWGPLVISLTLGILLSIRVSPAAESRMSTLMTVP